jgi:hypothetical protein
LKVEVTHAMTYLAILALLAGSAACGAVIVSIAGRDSPGTRRGKWE